jgi:ApaG protein
MLSIGKKMAKKLAFEVEAIGTANYLRERSSPENNEYIWSYTVEITNHDEEIIQLLSRFWRITDATSKSREVHGHGVVSQQPIIMPGESFRYSSFSLLNTNHGSMRGYFEMQTLRREVFVVEIDEFELAQPIRLAVCNG